MTTWHGNQQTFVVGQLEGVFETRVCGIPEVEISKYIIDKKLVMCEKNAIESLSNAEQ